jgi:cystathionine beta-synthase
VVLFPDHASRYAAKAFNDDWMRERGFLDKGPVTAGDILTRKKGELITLSKDAKVQEAVMLMQNSDIDQVVITEDDKIVGSLTEIRLYSQLLENPDIKHYTVEKIMEKPFPTVESNVPYTELSTLINRENPAVLVKQTDGKHQIITKYDIIQALAG